MGRAIFLVVKDGMAVRERATANILPRKADWVTLVQQRRIRHDFTVAPVDRQGAGGHFFAVGNNLGDLTLDTETFRDRGQFLAQLLDRLQRNAGLALGCPLVAEVRSPVNVELFVGLFDQGFDHVLAIIQGVTVVVLHLLGFFLGDNTGFHQLIHVQVAGGLQLADFLVHDRLGCCRLVRFVVTTTTIADQIDHHVVLEFVAIIHRHLCHEHDRFRVIRIHMQNRRLDHLGNVGTVFRGSRIFLLAGGKTNLVVDHDMNGATNAEAAGLGHLEGFHHHALAGKCCVAVHDNRNDLGALIVVTAGLTSPDRALNNRRNDFKV